MDAATPHSAMHRTLAIPALDEKLAPAGPDQPALAVCAVEPHLPDEDMRTGLAAELALRAVPACDPADAAGDRKNALAASVLLHAKLAGLLVAAALVFSPGATDRETEAISVELAPSEVLDAIEPGEEANAAAASQPAPASGVEDAPDDAPEETSEPPPREGPAEAEERAEATPPGPAPLPPEKTQPAEAQRPALPSPTPPPERVAAAHEEGLHPPVEDAIEDATSPPQPPPHGPREAVKPEAAERDEAARAREQARRRKAAEMARRRRGEQADAPPAAAARGAEASAGSRGRVSASRGSISSYAAIVRARIAANRPVGAGRGTAIVSFGLSRSGGLVSARLSRSSGNPALDQAALAAVRRSAPFPPPPEGATPAQLRFSIPFHFR